MAAHADILKDIALCIVAATSFAFLAKWTRQPLILGYVAAGVVLGPAQGLGWLSSAEEIETVSELGLILLLFMIGLEIDLKKLRESGPSVGVTGAVQFAACVGLGLLVMPWLGFRLGGGDFGALYMAVASALSSTMIVVKLLYDKFELDTLPGRITLGILVIQDIWAILFLALQPNLTNPAVAPLLLSLAKGVALVALALAVSRYVLPPLFHSIARTPELMLIGTLAWCFGVAMLAAKLGLSREMGALIAGIAISTFPYNLDVIAKVISLRDFFITLFFVTLGAKIPRPTAEVVLAAVAAAAFVVLSRFVTISPVLHRLGNGNRASILPAINLAQVSEFSLVIGALGVSLGHITQQTLSVIVFTMVLTSVASTYGILYNHDLFKRLNPMLRRLGMRDLDETAHPGGEAQTKEIVFLGFTSYASSLLHDLLQVDPTLAERICVVDFNPGVKRELDRRGIRALYGDVAHLDTLHHAAIHEARVLLSTVPDVILKGTTNERLLRALAAIAPEARVIVTAETLVQARDLYHKGAAFVFLPRLTGAAELRDVVLAALNGEIEPLRLAAREALDLREEVLP